MIESISEPRRANRRIDIRAQTGDRLPPHSLEAEAGALGCCLLEPSALDEIIVKLGDKKEAFYDLKHQTIYEALVQMRGEMQPVNDLIAVQQFLKDRQLLEPIGGIAYLNQLQDAIPSAANLTYYLNFLCEKYLIRRLINTCTGIVGKGYDYEGNPDELLSEAEREVLAIRQTFSRGHGSMDISTLQKRLVEIYEQAESGLTAGLTSDFVDFNRKLGGFMGQEMIVIGGTPSAGKTTLAINLAWQIACKGTVVSIKSLETSGTKLLHRLHCMAGRVDSAGFLHGSASQEDMEKMVVAMKTVADQRERIILSDDAMTDAQLVASCRQDYQKGARFFVVDMLQNIQTKADGETAKVSLASTCIKNLAKELNVPIVVTSALSRMETDKQGKVRRPTMHDLRQSGQIESDADKIVLLHCPEREGDVREVTAIAAKNKDGPLGDISFTFFASQFRFETAAAISDSDVPAEQSHRYND